MLKQSEIQRMVGKMDTVATYNETLENDLRGTLLWDLDDVDWNSFKNWRDSFANSPPSSMLVPCYSSAVGDNFHYARAVLGINFAALCWLLQHDYTADEIEDAWQHMPVIKPGKTNRGAPGGNRASKWKRWKYLSPFPNARHAL